VHAEAGFETAGHSLRELVHLSRSGTGFRPTLAAHADIIPALEKARENFLELARRHPEHPTLHRRLTEADERLAALLFTQGRTVEARAFLDEAIASSGRLLAGDPRDVDAMTHRFQQFRLSALLLEPNGKVEESAGDLAAAVSLGELLLRLRPDLRITCDLADCRCVLAEMEDRLGRGGRSRSLILANIEMLDRRLTDVYDPATAVRRVLARDDLVRFGGESPTPPDTLAASSPGSPLSRLASAEADRLPVETWAELFVRVLDPPFGVEGTSPYLKAESGYFFIDLLVKMAAERRRSGHLDDARRSADRMLAVARFLVARYPDQTGAHLALSEAYVQLHKNAWRSEDRAAVLRYLRLSIDAAKQALVLDPDNAIARNRSVDLRRRLDKMPTTP
jgi:tetratricopeptide (TPR) repeat protein